MLGRVEGAAQVHAGTRTPMRDCVQDHTRPRRADHACMPHMQPYTVDGRNHYAPSLLRIILFLRSPEIIKYFYAPPAAGIVGDLRRPCKARTFDAWMCRSVWLPAGALQGTCYNQAATPQCSMPNACRAQHACLQDGSTAPFIRMQESIRQLRTRV
jgi:hypothetical protein